MGSLRPKDVYTGADGDDGIQTLNDGLVGTINAVMEMEGKILLCYSDGRIIAVYEEGGFTVFEELEVPQC